MADIALRKHFAVRVEGPLLQHSDGHRTIYEGYWVPIGRAWWRVPEKGNPLGEAVVWYVSLRGNIEIRCFVPTDAS